MKKLILLLSLCAALIIIIFSCKQSFDYEPTTAEVKSPDNSVESIIQAFKIRLESNLKDEKTYSTDSAIWYSTALLNYTYAIYDSALTHINCDTTTFSIALNRDNRVEESDLNDLIDQMTDSLETQYDGLQETTKHLVFCMVYEIATYQGRLDLGMIGIIGYGFSTSYYPYFDEEDYWFAILDSGKCDEYAPAYKGVKDAGEEIEFKILNPLIASDPNYRIYTIPGSEEFFENVDPQEYPYANSPCGYRGYFHLGQGVWSGPQCLDPDHLNFYLSTNGISYIIEDLQPQGLDFIWIDIDGELLLNYPSYEEVHLLDLLYSETYQTIVPISEL